MENFGLDISSGLSRKLNVFVVTGNQRQLAGAFEFDPQDLPDLFGVRRRGSA